MISFLVFVLGAIVGSFLNAVIFRLHSRRSFISGRSECMHCGHVLSAWDLVPIFSFIYLRGRCRYCGKKLSWQYPIVELTTGIVLVLLAQNFQFSIFNFQFWIQVIFASFLIVIGVYDFKHYLILDKVVYPAIVLAFIWSIVNGYFLNSLLGAFIIAGFFALQYFVSKGRWIGFGDVKFGIFLGLLFGVKLGLVLLMLGYFLGAVAGLILIGLGRKNLASKMPFGTFLATSGIIVMLYGDQMANWYIKLIGL